MRPSADLLDRQTPKAGGPWGVNVVGHFLSGTQVGEAARQLVNVLDASGIPSVPVQDSADELGSSDGSYPTVSSAEALYAVNLVCSMPEAMTEFGRQAQRFFGGRYSIAFWSGAERPPADILSLFQELWAPSMYVAETLAGVRLPVELIPVPVEPSACGAHTRSEYGLPDDKFLFVYSFDIAEGLERKNPTAVIHAFRRAFQPDDPACLVINCVVPEGWVGDLEPLRAAAGEHPGVQVFAGPMNRPACLGLTSICDCFVSLHRAEPIALPLAEAMWFGKPVIATGHSGNLDFMTPVNGLLVEYGSPHASEPTGACVEPDVEIAARSMRRVFEDPAAARALGLRAAADIRRTNSLVATARLVSRRLEGIRAGCHVHAAAANVRERPAALAFVHSRVAEGPPMAPRDGRRNTARRLVRKAVLRTLRPYSDHQQNVNMALLEAVDELHEIIVRRNAELLSEIRAGRQLRDAVVSQARELDEIRRAMTLDADRGLYLALSELGRRHAQIAPPPGEFRARLGLAASELRAYSQNGEDGVIAEIMRRVGTTNCFFVEFGVESGREGNCVFLADVAGWSGLFMEADPEFYRLLERKYRPRRDVRTVQARVSPENIERLLDDAGVPMEPDLMSIDIDGQDYWVWEAMDAFRPRVLVIEYNSALDPGRRLVQPRDDQGWDGTDYFGASLGAMRSLGERKGYHLVHTELAGSNAFLVRAELAEGRFLDFDEMPKRGMPNYFQSGYRHPPDARGRRYLDLDTGELVGSSG